MTPTTTKKKAPGDLARELEQKLSSLTTQREESAAQVRAQENGLPFSSLRSSPIDGEALGLVEEAEARQNGLAVIGQQGPSLTVAVLDPTNPETQQSLTRLRDRGFQVSLTVTTRAGLALAHKRYATIKKAEVFEVGAITIDETQVDTLSKDIRSVTDISTTIAHASATQLLEIAVAGAIATQASDIHFEPEAEDTRIRYRLDGLLQDVGRVPHDQFTRLLNRIKVLSRLKLNVHKSPQDGRFTIRHRDAPIEVRTSVLPSEHGETVVMRLLDPRTINANLEALGMRPDLLSVVKEQLAKPNGAILTTGPTGSGKTTTLYAFVNHLNSPDTKIITVEDPIEYHIKGISQTQVDQSKEYTFAAALRSIVRQDPDIILVGEIRDSETADIALNAALTGHLVLSTIHTNDAAGTIPRLIDLGIRPPVIAPAISLAMGQRLVRRLCTACKREATPDEAALAHITSQLEPIRERFALPPLTRTLSLFHPVGCASCNGTGYKGRIGVYELFLVTREMEKLILSQPAISQVRDLAIAQGMVTMLQDGYMKLLEGVTSLEEIQRVLG